MHDDLYHAVPQRADLAADNFQPVRPLTRIGSRI